MIYIFGVYGIFLIYKDHQKGGTLIYIDRSHIANFMWNLFISILIISAIIMINRFFGDYSNHTTENSRRLKDNTGLLSYIFNASFVRVLLVGPILEELAFRYVFLGSLIRANFDKWTSIVVVSTIFTLFHFYSFQNSVHIFVLSMILGHIFLKFGILASIFTHIICNLSIIILTYLIFSG